ncbi:MAG: 30S ribosomal protein S5 [Candidatus Altiarchaeales archaeon]|nr:MAG: 30S ribosomal protein S5 [Candidatus Altiarchaeales archaeon]RLI95217.1 MAG: 30S ribosomal protein S5 [Candidatus Altiarchaeales archaeon]RLI95251.1 MAG: 30S ribosomal protein S5 [Candidatus Altiarchaeales archaeon]HDO82638.1 30S ribosomal protein S5 [Candidatus Altiarchaeales archaeon]HEX55287.1 30S ribosomal protein S5 [Candidatus Altiarchaeales archaeon]
MTKNNNNEIDEDVEEVLDERINLADWEPKTDLGRRVKNGEFANISEVLRCPQPIREVEIIDYFLPNLREEIIDVTRVQRVTDSGRRMKFRVVTAVGNGDGFIGVGKAKGKEAGQTIRKSIERAKLNLKEIKRGCGSWECGCGEPHSVPFKVFGKCGSVRVTLKPAPKGTGLVSGEIAKKILDLAGIKDVYTHTEGHTRTSINFAFAVLDALDNTNRIKLKDSHIKELGIITGFVEAD